MQGRGNINVMLTPLDNPSNTLAHFGFKVNKAKLRL